MTHESTIRSIERLVFRADERNEARVKRVQPKMGFGSADKKRRDVKNPRT